MSDLRSWTWRHAISRSKLPPTTRHVLLALSLYMNDVGGSCYPTQEQLARDTGLTERAVRAHLAKAEKLGWVQRKEHGFRGQRWRNHEYSPKWPNDEPEEQLESAEPERVEPEKGAEPRSGASSKGAERHVKRCGTSRQKVRNHVPPNIPPYFHNPSNAREGARGGTGFDLIWVKATAAKIPLPSRSNAFKRFLKLPEQSQQAALVAWENYLRVMKAQGRGEQAFLMPFLTPEAIAEWQSTPQVNLDGRFVITPECEAEWRLWMDHFKAGNNGRTMVDHYTKLGRVVTAYRWPPTKQEAA